MYFSQQLQLAIQNKDFSQAETLLRRALQSNPRDDNLRLKLANLLVQLGRAQEAADLFGKNDANGLFNRAYYLGKGQHTEHALSCYRQAIAMGLEGAEEAYNNMGSLLREASHRDNEAEEAFRHALNIAPHYASALINLANLYEDQGYKDKAKQALESIPERDPLYPLALCRLAGLGFNEDINRRLHAQLQNTHLSPDLRCDILYAIGHQWDKAGQYLQASKAFDAANALNSQLIPAYSAPDWEAKCAEVIARPPNANMAPANEQSTFFICGMFRSGSTLLEQMLASHPNIAAGGELSFFPKLAAEAFDSPLNEALQNYLEQLNKARQTKRWVSDKRNDNLWNIDLIKQLFPQAKIIITDRDIEDCAVSIYQQRLGPAMNYACNMAHIRHYEGLCQKLREHWLHTYPNDVQCIAYEDLIRHPQATLSKVLNALGEEWDDQCLNFQQLRNTVKTASVWQVRQPLSDSSIGRAKRYDFSS